MRLEGASWPGHSLLSHCCDFTLLLLLLLLCQSYQEDGKKTNINLCAIESLLDLYMYYMYQVRGR